MHYKCASCGKNIDKEREIVALSRGQEPKYCSPRCRNLDHSRRYEERKRAAKRD